MGLAWVGLQTQTPSLFCWKEELEGGREGQQLDSPQSNTSVFIFCCLFPLCGLSCSLCLAQGVLPFSSASPVLAVKQSLDDGWALCISLSTPNRSHSREHRPKHTHMQSIFSTLLKSLHAHISSLVIHYSYLSTRFSYPLCFLSSSTPTHHSQSESLNIICYVVFPGSIIHQQLPFPSHRGFPGAAEKLTVSVLLLSFLLPALDDSILCVSTWMTECLCVCVARSHEQPGVSKDTPAFLTTIELLPAIEEIRLLPPSLPLDDPVAWVSRSQGHFQRALERLSCLLSLADWTFPASSHWTDSLCFVGIKCQTKIQSCY